MIYLFEITPETINLGDAAILTWDVVNATSVFIDNGIGNVGLNGSWAVQPLESTTYTLTASHSNGAIRSWVVELTVVE